MPAISPKAFLARYGASAEFATEQILRVLLPGAPHLVDAVCTFFAEPSAEKDKVIERTLQIVTTDLRPVFAQVARLERLPELVPQVIEVALETDERCRLALLKLNYLATQFAPVEAYYSQLFTMAGWETAMVHDFLPLARRLFTVAEFVSELNLQHVHGHEFAHLLELFSDGVRSFQAQHYAETQQQFGSLIYKTPETATPYLGLSLSSGCGGQWRKALQALSEAMHLCSDDADLQKAQTWLVRKVEEDATRAFAEPASAHLPQVGDSIDEWRLEQFLSQRSRERIFLATNGQERMILKAMLPEFASDEKVAQRFRREMETLLHFSEHPNVVRIEEVSYSSQWHCWYVVLEHVQGQSLENYLATHGALPQRQAVELVRQVALAVAAAHQLEVTIGEIEPSRILLREVKDGLVPIVNDFGITSLRREGSSNQDFLAPEQKEHQLVEKPTDVFALAATLYHAIAYHSPRDRKVEHYREELLAPRLRPIVEQALQRDRMQRPADAAHFAQALQQLLVPLQRVLEIPGELCWYEYQAWQTYPQGHGQKVTTPGLVPLDFDLAYSFRSSEVTDNNFSELQFLSNLQALDLNGCAGLTNRGLTQLRDHPHLVSLDLSHCENLETVRLFLMPRLQALDVSHCEHLTHLDLEHCEHLRVLSLRGCSRLKDEALETLDFLPQLEVLDLGDCTHITDRGLAWVRKLTTLQSLNLSGCERLTDEGMVHLRHLLDLRSLDVSRCSQPTTAHLRHLNHLQTLDLHEWQDLSTLHLEHLTELLCLNLSRCHNLHDEDLVFLRHLSHLRTLQLSECDGLTDAGLVHLRHLLHLESLDVSHCPQLQKFHLRHLPSLHTLDLTDCERLTTIHLQHLPKLHSLSLAGCTHLRDASLAFLHGLTGLQSLSLRGCERITDEGLKHLRHLSQLRVLDLSRCPQLRDVHLRHLPNLRMLDLSECDRLFAIHLYQIKNLQSLDLRWCPQLTDLGISSIQHLRNLRMLALSGCRTLSENSLEYIRHLKNLKALHLLECNISSEALARIIHKVANK